MTYIIVETGSVVTGANSYVTLDDCATYCLARGLSFATSPSSTGEEALIRATASVDAGYRIQFSGYRTQGRTQSLEWPRTAAYDSEGIVIETNVIPIELKNAVCELAVREYADSGSTMPDLDRGGHITEVHAGSVGVTYAAGASVMTVFQLVDSILARLLGATVTQNSGVARRG